MKIVTIIPLQKGIFKTDLTYFTAKDIENGSIVSVPVRTKKILGLVVSSEDVSKEKSDIKKMSFNLKKIIEVKKHSIFRNEFIEAGLELSSYFLAKKNSGLISLIPNIFREKYDTLEKFENPINLEDKENKKKDNIEIKNIRTEKLLFQANLEDRLSYYKTLIRSNFALKKSIFLVLPTKYDIEIFSQALSKGIENFCFTLHHDLKPKKIIENYEKIIKSPHSVLIIGTAQFLSIPRKDIETIILEHESSNAYKMIPKPHFDLRIFTEIFATKINAKFILGDTLLRFETIARKNTDNLSEIYPMSFRINPEQIKIALTDPEEETEKFQIFRERTLEDIEENLKNKKNIFIFSLRKGLATYTICKDCNEIVNCEKCLAPVVLYLSRDGKKRMFICNKCGTEKDPETKCENCASWNLMPLGIGTDTVIEELKNQFKVKIFKLDKETVKTAKQAEKIIEEFEQSSGTILVGTEMAFFYLKEKVNLSVIASFDSLWTIPNFKMSEKIIQLLLSTLSKTKHKLIIQTKNKKDTTLLSFQSENLLSFVREEIEERKNLNYPPFKRFIKITFLGDKEKSLEAKKLLQNLLEDYQPEIFSNFIAKNKNQYSTNALLRIEPKKWSLLELSTNSAIDPNLKNILSSLSPTFEISIDPEDLL